MDRIALQQICVMGKHGADPGERDHVQQFEIDLDFGIDLHEAAATDALAATVDYAVLYERICALVELRSHVLLERVASEICDLIFSDARISDARVRVSKPGKLNGATPSVEILRSNQRYNPQ